MNIQQLTQLYHSCDSLPLCDINSYQNNASYLSDRYKQCNKARLEAAGQFVYNIGHSFPIALEEMRSNDCIISNNYDICNIKKYQNINIEDDNDYNNAIRSIDNCLSIYNESIDKYDNVNKLGIEVLIDKNQTINTNYNISNNNYRPICINNKSNMKIEDMIGCVNYSKNKIKNRINELLNIKKNLQSRRYQYENNISIKYDIENKLQNILTNIKLDNKDYITKYKKKLNKMYSKHRNITSMIQTSKNFINDILIKMKIKYNSENNPIINEYIDMGINELKLKIEDINMIMLKKIEDEDILLKSNLQTDNILIDNKLDDNMKLVEILDKDITRSLYSIYDVLNTIDILIKSGKNKIYQCDKLPNLSILAQIADINNMALFSNNPTVTLVVYMIYKNLDITYAYDTFTDIDLIINDYQNFDLVKLSGIPNPHSNMYYNIYNYAQLKISKLIHSENFDNYFMNYDLKYKPIMKNDIFLFSYLIDFIIAIYTNINRILQLNPNYDKLYKYSDFNYIINLYNKYSSDNTITIKELYQTIKNTCEQLLPSRSINILKLPFFTNEPTWIKLCYNISYNKKQYEMIKSIRESIYNSILLNK